jgi:hypothetical protein
MGIWQVVFGIKSHLNLQISTKISSLLAPVFSRTNEVEVWYLLSPWQEMAKIRQ